LHSLDTKHCRLILNLPTIYIHKHYFHIPVTSSLSGLNPLHSRLFPSGKTPRFHTHTEQINYTYTIQSLFNESVGQWLLYIKLRFSLNGSYAKLHPETAHILIKPTVYNYPKIIPLCKQLKKLCLYKQTQLYDQY
jgi:hypothetical protein